MALQYFPSEADAEYIYGVLDKTTGESVTYRRVTTWVDQTRMTDAKCDSILYRKHVNGFYYKRYLPNGRINMAWYLDGSGSVDNKDNWRRFLTYIRQQNDPNNPYIWKLTFPAGTYYSSEVTRWVGRGRGLGDKVDFLWEAGCEFTYPGACAGWRIYGQYNTKLFYSGVLRLRATGYDGEDGKVDVANCPAQMAFIAQGRVPLHGVNRAGKTLQWWLDQPAGTMMHSVNPGDYKWHGLWTSTVLEGLQVDVTGFSGAGVFCDGSGVELKIAKEADGSLTEVDEHNCSLGSFLSLKTRGCGHGAFMFAKDANNIYIENCDVRECRSGVGFIDASQSGCHIKYAHGAVNLWGTYWMLAPGNWTTLGTYDETDNLGFSVFAGNGNVFGGPQNANYYIVSDFASVYRGRDTVGLNLNSPGIGGNMAWVNNANKFDQFLIENLQNNGNILEGRYGGEANKRGLFEILNGGQYSIGGKFTDRKAPRMRFPNGFGLGKAEIYPVRGFDPPAARRFFPGDILFNLEEGSNVVPYWRCIQDGYIAPYSYATEIGVAIEDNTATDTPGQSKRTVAPSQGILIYDTFFLNGNLQTVVNPPVPDSQGRMCFSIGQPQLLGGPVMPVYRTAIFVAEGKAYGTTAQRPVLRQNADYGFTYWNTTLTKLEYWNGTSFS